MLARPAHHAPRLDASRRTPGSLHPEPKYKALGQFTDGQVLYTHKAPPLPGGGHNSHNSTRGDGCAFCNFFLRCGEPEPHADSGHPGPSHSGPSGAVPARIQ